MTLDWCNCAENSEVILAQQTITQGPSSSEKEKIEQELKQVVQNTGWGPKPLKTEEQPKTLDQMVPEPYLSKYWKIFKEGMAQRFPKSQTYNHTIDLVEGYKVPTPKGPYRLTE